MYDLSKLKKLKLTVTANQKGTRFVYKVYEGSKLVYKSTPTHRRYVAMIGTDGAVMYRFGRMDLIGKGDSGKFLNNLNSGSYQRIDYWVATI